ncbi:uncharacterized protein LOC120358483 [Solenopsis invicta]|uniref:uncharacterized protein LOC120358483 n=1 Tax=Solenopsis invicta TaxID=13686 RepID=UPI00193CF9A7|nr:uncharacterized protein LOC120358483 [Solenopsis invicta]
MAAIGQLIVCRNTDDAVKVLRAILIISRPETEGMLLNGEETTCEREKNKLRSVLTGILDYEDIENSENNNDNNDIIEEDAINEIEDNEWSRRGNEINNQVDQILNEVANRDNAHYFPTLAKRLLQDIAIFPLWSNVCRDNFGYGRIPASSASVEGEFNKIKNCILKNYSVPMRCIFKNLFRLSSRKNKNC